MEKALQYLLKTRDNVLKALDGKIGEFRLAGGTALSIVYFRHRISFDLDFFTKNFSERRVMAIISEISGFLHIPITSIKKANIQDEAKMFVCHLPVEENNSPEVDDNKRSLKIDFVEDVYREIESRDVIVNGISVMSQENIYLRKIYAAFGVVKSEDAAGKEKFLGGRQEARDVFDLYYLSHVFMPLSQFMAKYCMPDEKVSAITWHGRYDRFGLRSELIDIITDKKIDCRLIERHFDSEIEKIAKQIIEE